MLESRVERRLKKRVEALGCGVMCRKLESPGFAGMPDRMIMLPGEKVIFVETKQPGKKERARQEYVQGLIRELGFEVWSAVDTVERVDAVVQRCKELME